MTERVQDKVAIVTGPASGLGETPARLLAREGAKVVLADGIFLGTKHAIRAMKKNRPLGGSIVNLSSIEGIVGNPNLGSCNASKGGVRLYTKSVALYCAESRLGIRVNSVHPAPIATPMVENQLRDRGVENIEMALRTMDFMHPIGRMGEPDDVAYSVLYLASDEAKFVTGTELTIDGGYTAQ